MTINRFLNSIKLKRYKKRGLIVGKNFNMESRVHIDPGFPWLVKIGNNVTLAPEVMILAHDASEKKAIGNTSVAKVTIGDNVFIGAKSIILQGVTIGDNVIIGAGSIVTRNIPSNSIACGCPAKTIKEIDTFAKEKTKLYNNSTTISISDIKAAKKDVKLREHLQKRIGNERAYIYEE